MYQPWCGGDPDDPYVCTGWLNISAWWAEPGNADKGSDGSRAHWGLLSVRPRYRARPGSCAGGQPLTTPIRILPATLLPLPALAD